MFEIFFQGCGLGFVLAIMVGPLTVSLLHTAIEKGKPAGFTVAMGIWFSDFLFMLSVYFGFQYVEALINFEKFEQWVAIVGSIILTIIGLGILKTSGGTEALKAPALKAKDWVTAFSQGFMINTVNPFSFIFWTSVMGAVVIKNNWSPLQSFFFFLGIMITIMFSDTGKVLLSSPLNRWLTPHRWRIIKRISGISFLIFGVILLVRVFGGF